MCEYDFMVMMCDLTCPASMTAFTLTPSSEPDATVALNISPEDKTDRKSVCVHFNTAACSYSM